MEEAVWIDREKKGKKKNGVIILNLFNLGALFLYLHSFPFPLQQIYCVWGKKVVVWKKKKNTYLGNNPK